MKKIYLIFVAFAAITLVGASCIKIGSRETAGVDGGVWRSGDKGVTWEHKVTSPTAQGIGSIAGINIVDMVLDPQDENAIYLSSAGNGLFYSWDSAETWKYVESLGSGFVNGVAIDYKDKCTIYVALQNKIFKTSDCTRTWKEQYFDTRSDIFISQLAIDPKNSNILYAGLSKGDLLQSTDAGRSWTTIHRFNNKVVEMFIHPVRPNEIILGLENGGLWKSTNSGNTWRDLGDKLKDFRGSNNVFDMKASKGASRLYLLSSYGIINSKDFGETWKKIKLLTPPGTVKIHSFAINPENTQEIYYATASTFYSSSDGGINWATKKLPTSRAGTAMLVNPKNTNTILMGTRSFNKK